MFSLIKFVVSACVVILLVTSALSYLIYGNEIVPYSVWVIFSILLIIDYFKSAIESLKDYAKFSAEKFYSDIFEKRNK